MLSKKGVGTLRVVYFRILPLASEVYESEIRSIFSLAALYFIREIIKKRLATLVTGIILYTENASVCIGIVKIFFLFFSFIFGF